MSGWERMSVSPRLPAWPNVALSVLSTVVGVYLIELVAAATQPGSTDIHIEAARLANVPFDTRTRYQVFSDLRDEGRDAYPGLNAAQLTGLAALEHEGVSVLPLAGIADTWTIHCNESGEYTLYQADEHGFNNPPGQHARSDIVLVGDSFTHGNCVPAGEDIAGQLRQRRRNALSLGYSGDGPLMELATLREYAAPLGPGTVLWLYYEGNDLEDLEVEAKNPLLRKYLDADFTQDLPHRQAEVDSALKAYIEATAAGRARPEARGWRDTPLARVARLQHTRARLQTLWRSSRPSPVPPPLLEETLAAAKDLTTAWGGRFIIVYLPSWRRYAAEADAGELYHRDRVLAIARRLDIPVIDIHETFRQHPDPLALFPFRVEGHYTAEGYALVASAIDSYLGTRTASPPR